MGKDAPKLQEDIEVGLCVRSNMLCLMAHMAVGKAITDSWVSTFLFQI